MRTFIVQTFLLAGYFVRRIVTCIFKVIKDSISVNPFPGFAINSRSGKWKKIIMICLFTCFTFLMRITAQDIHNSTNLIIQSGVTVATSGAWNNSGFIVNNGSIILTGDWINTLVYQGFGAVVLKGSDQQINNNHQSFYSLSIDGGGSKTLQGSVMIDQLLAMKDGIVKVSDSDTLRLWPNADVEGGSSLSYVDGAIIAHGTGYKFFPVGKNGKYHPVELLNVTGITPATEVEAHENLSPIVASLPATPMADIYWTQKIIQGVYEGSPVTVRYNIPENIETDRVVILEGSSPGEEFTVRETKVEYSNDLDLVESRHPLKGNILVLGALTAEPPREHYFSTTLSPHASNPDNRRIKFFGDQITTKDFRFQVFNRWGLVIYETTSADSMMDEGWDGTQNGNLLPSGVYPYSLTYAETSGKLVKRTGFITIIQ